MCSMLLVTLAPSPVSVTTASQVTGSGPGLRSDSNDIRRQQSFVLVKGCSSAREVTGDPLTINQDMALIWGNECKRQILGPYHSDAQTPLSHLTAISPTHTGEKPAKNH
jgi:hypothetical protein